MKFRRFFFFYSKAVFKILNNSEILKEILIGFENILLYQREEKGPYAKNMRNVANYFWLQFHLTILSTRDFKADLKFSTFDAFFGRISQI